MSKIHAEIFLKNNALIIIDKNSQNGVLVNGKKIKKETHLIRNDKIICGKTSFKII